MNYTYHGNESVATIKYGDNSIIRDIDSTQNMTGLSINDVKLADLKYTTKGLLERIDFKNNVASIEKQYEKETRLQNEIVTTKDSQETFTYGYDENHNITSAVSNEGNVTYVYDDLNQLEDEIYSNGTTIHYTYDAVGNRTSKTTTKNGSTTTVDYLYNDANQLKNVSGQAYEVDANGNLLNDGNSRYDWNAFD
ncbi:hypothetical protein MKZ01_14000 [Lysinibacillus endophyticus]|uniref:hypothetical protein n=1 Tax=Ureibacillus endophyticus TaxID=1978490 RepID=UPI003135C840